MKDELLFNLTLLCYFDKKVFPKTDSKLKEQVGQSKT